MRPLWCPHTACTVSSSRAPHPSCSAACLACRRSQAEVEFDRLWLSNQLPKPPQPAGDQADGVGADAEEDADGDAAGASGRGGRGTYQTSSMRTVRMTVVRERWPQLVRMLDQVAVDKVRASGCV